jgi:hypothetical protein
MFEFGASLKELEGVAGAAKAAGRLSTSELASKLFADSHAEPTLATATSIPLHTEDKLIPAGTHDVTFPDVVKRFGYTPDRQLMLEGLVYGSQPLKEAEVPFFLLGGRFIRNEVPRDFDIAWPSAGANTELIKQREPSFMSGTWKEQKRKYGGEFRRDDMQMFHKTRDGKPAGVLRVDLSTVPSVSETVGSSWFEDTVNAPAIAMHAKAIELAQSSNPKDAIPVFSAWLRRSEEQLAVRDSSRILEMPELNDGATLLVRYRQFHKFLRDIKETPPDDLESRISKLETVLMREAMRVKMGGGW